LDADWSPLAQNDITTLTGSLYGMWGQNDWSFGGSVGVAGNRFASKRFLPDNGLPGNGQFLSARYSGNIFFISAEASRKMRLVNGDLTPFYSLDLYHVNQTGLSEGPNGVHLDGARFETLLQMLGFRFSRRMDFGWIVLDPELRAAWLHDYGFETYRLTGRFADGTPISTHFEAPDRNRAYTALQLTGTFWHRHTFYALYGTEQGHSFRTHRIGLGYGLAF